jgi:hypothetical protein
MTSKITEEIVRQRIRQNTTLAAVLLMSVAVAFAGCGGGSEAPPTTPVVQNARVIGQYNLVLTSTDGRGTTNIYTDFTQTGTTFAGATNTLVCPSNDLSQCKGDNASVISMTPSGTVSGANVTMVGSATGTSLAGTYTDSLGDFGTWIASTEIHPFGPPPAVYDFSGTFNSTLIPASDSPNYFY